MGNSRSILDYLRRVAGTADPAPPDDQLLELFHRTRDEAAFAVLVQRHGALVLGVCRRVLRDEHDAEDAFQATFLTLARKGGAVRLRTSLSCWLYKVAYHLALRLKTRVARERCAPAAAQSEPRPGQDRRADPEGDLTWREIRAALDDELQHLPEAYRAPLVLCYLVGKTLDEAAEQLSWTTGSVKGRLERGRRMLRARLERRGLTLPAALMALGLAQGADAAVRPELVRVTVKVAVGLASGAPTGAVLPARVLELTNLGAQATSPTTCGALTIFLSALAAVGLSAGLWLVALAGPAGQPPTPPLPPGDAGAFSHADGGAPRPSSFRDVTRECGLEAVLNEGYRANPDWRLSGLHLVDLDGDGHLDFFMSALDRGQALAALNDGRGRFKAAAGRYPTTGIFLVGDLNEDGRADLTANFENGGSQWWTNRSRPGFLWFEPTKITRPTNTARRQALIDVDRDGRVDWIRGEPGRLAFDLSDGAGGFIPSAVTIATGDISGFELLCLPVDINGDGFIDFLVETGHHADSRGRSRVYLNDGKTGFRDATEECGLPRTGLAIKGVADLNRDSFPDLLVLEDMRPEVYLNDGTGKFTRKPGAVTGMDRAAVPTHASWGVAVMTDLDNDGIPDLIWNGRNFLWILRGTGGGNFQYANPEWGIKDLASSAVDDGHCFGDLDGDGRLDIVGYTKLGTQRRFAVYRNELPQRNWLRVRPVGPAGNQGAAGAKIRLYAPGTSQLLWYEQVAIYNSQSAQSYYNHTETERHYGLGTRRTVDAEVEFYPSAKRVRIAGVAANTTVRVREESP